MNIKQWWSDIDRVKMAEGETNSDYFPIRSKTDEVVEYENKMLSRGVMR